MKVLMICGSPHEHGCTDRALEIIGNELNNQGIESEIFWIGTGAVHSCRGCNFCRENGKCIYDDDIVNELSQRARDADGYIFASPVHYASPAGSMLSVMDRLFWSTGKYMKFKPAASVVCARRSGTTASYDVLNKYIGISNLIQVPSSYWNMIHGETREDVDRDEEGVSIMKTIASNMAWILKILNSCKGTDLERPMPVEKARTNFIR